MPDFPSFTDMKTGLSETFNETVTSIEKSWENEPEPGKDAVEQKNEVVTLGRPAVKRLQARLASLGFRSGAVDGIYGSQTAKAVKRYQTAHRLPVTGKVTSGFLEHLDTTIASGNAGHMLTNSPY